MRPGRHPVKGGALDCCRSALNYPMRRRAPAWPLAPVRPPNNATVGDSIPKTQGSITSDSGSPKLVISGFRAEGVGAA
jgi:hypothetical protein